MFSTFANRQGKKSSSLEQLLQRTLVIVAHPDDEAVTCGALLQRIAYPTVVFCTDGTPDNSYFWGDYKSREAYQQLRKSEAQRALEIGGVSSVEFLAGTSAETIFRDQYLYRALPQAISKLEDTLLRVRPDAVLAPAYEGGHPDHDCCSFLASVLGRKYGISVWEMPLYHRCRTDSIVCQRFFEERGTEISVVPTEKELEVKKQMIDSYQSQKTVWDFVRPGLVETFRPQAQYDYSRPPHPGRLNYEVWGWSVSGGDVCRAFNAFEARVPDLQALLARAAGRRT